MSKRPSKSAYSTPTRSQKVLAIIGLIVVLSMVLSALALDFGSSQPPPATQPPITILFIGSPTPEPTPAPTSSSPASPTPGLAPAPP